MLLALAALACLAMSGRAAAATFPGAISGTVTDAGTAEPVADLEVCAFLFEEEEEWHCAETNSDGEYEIADLPAGEWGVEFWGAPRGYIPQFWDGKERWSEAGPVVVGSTPVTGIDAQLLPGGEIQGTVREASGGAPVAEAEVCAWGLAEGLGEFFAGCVVPDGTGHYALRGLKAAEYEVAFYPYEGNLVTQFYDHKAHWWEADFVPVAAEEVVTGIDADLEAGAQISGTLYSDATGSPLPFISVCSIEAASGELWGCTQSDEDGRYVLDRLLAGSYKVVFSIDFEQWYEEDFGGEEDDGFPTEFWNNQATLAAANPIALATGQSVTGIDARLGPPPFQPPAAVVTPPPAATPLALPAPKRKHCRKGFKRKKVKGKYRCVKRKKHLRRHHHHAR